MNNRIKSFFAIIIFLTLGILNSCKDDDEPVLLPTLATLGANNVMQTSASSGGLISDDGGGLIIERGICWSTSQDPTIDLSTKSSDGESDGSYTSQLTNLTAGTTYFVRAYSTNSAGTAYGNEVSFETLPPDTEGILATLELSNLTATSATTGGLISDDGGAEITARGVCWDTNPTPTTELSTKSFDGNGTGSYTSQLTELITGTTYYVRAYATNNVGTSYGNEISFMTNDSIPELTTTDISNITFNSASSGGSISHDGGGDIQSRGVVWSTFENPNISNSSFTEDGTGTGEFESNITNLEPGTLYYLRSHAANSEGVAYGNQVSFETEITTPTITTNEATNVTSSTAIISAILESNGGNNLLESGICWSTNSSPTIDDTKIENENNEFPFDSELTGLDQNTTYYVRSYAANDAGISYGNEVTFKTFRLDLTSNFLFYFNGSSSNDETGSSLVLNPANTSLTTDRNGQSNGAHGLSRSNSYIELPSCLDLHNSVWTFSVWVKLTGAGDYDELTLLGHQSDNVGGPWRDIFASMKTWDLESNSEYAQLAFAKAGSYNLTNSYLSKNQWYQITVTQNESSIAFFINGSKVHEASGTFNDAYTCDLPYEISSKTRSSRRFDGSISDIRFYERDLNIIEVQEFYNGDL